MKHDGDKQRLFLLLFLSIVVSAAATLSFVSGVFAEEKKNVLILNSYHQGYKWTNDETRGVVEALAPVNEKIKIYIEYMGTKWVSNDQYFEQLNRMLQFKYRNIRFDVIVLSDDDALNFMVKYRDGIFGRVPTVFCGINYFTDDDLKGQTLYTGINEAADIKTNLEIALRLHPATKKIIIVNDTTASNKRLDPEFMKVLPAFRDRVLFEFLDDIEMEKLLEKVENLPSGNVIFYTTFFFDKTGRFYEYDESMQLISQRAKVPIYGAWDFSLGHGIVGGMLTSGYDQGKSAGEMALRILRGEKIENIPVVRKSPNRYMFDYQQMKRFGIKRSALPPESVLINEPVSFYAVHKSLVWGTLAGIVGLVFVVIVLLFNIRQKEMAEKALRKARDELDDRVRERTADLEAANNLLVNEIAERKQAEAALKESEEKYNSFFRTSRDCVFITSKDGRLIDLNDAAVELLGYSSREELLQVKIQDIYAHPEERAKHISLIAECGFAKELPMDLRRKDGTVRHTLVTSAARYDAEGNVIGFQGTIRDITERKLAEEAIRESEETYRSILNASPDDITITDMEGKIMMVSPAAKKMFGYEPEYDGFKGSHIVNFVVPDDRERARSNIRIKSQGGYTGPNEYHGLRKDQSIFDIEVNNGFIHDANGQPTKMVFIVRDVTERKKAEEERENLIIELRDAMSKIKTLSGMLPICASCKKIRDDKGYWNQIESYIKRHSDAEFSHSICPECAKKLYPEYYK
jgi:PAS domain S-box-containing protein